MDNQPELSEKIEDELWDVEMLARFLRVPVSWVYARSRFGELPGLVRLSARNLRFKPEAVRDWVAAGCPPVRENEIKSGSRAGASFNE